jgi:Flp pilus assembly protein TadD
LGRGVPNDQAESFAREVRKIARAFPADPFAASMQTAAEHLAANRQAASEAVERWLALEPDAPRALMYKSLIRFDMLSRARVKDWVSWTRARSWIEQARALAPRDPMILDVYYDSFERQGIEPPAHARAGLTLAMQLVPQFDELRLKVAKDLEQRGEIEAALFVLRPIAGHSQAH